MHWSIKFKTKGFSLVEIVVALGLFSIVSGALIMLLNVGLKLTRDDKARNGALAVATEKMEVIKNLPYNDVGTVGGVPAGDLAAIETVTLNNINYSVYTNIYYIDDAYDGLITTTDLLNTDYKKVKIKVTWNTANSSAPVVLVTNIVPQGLEEDSSDETGTLWLEVYDSTPAPVVNANISIVNNYSTPLISMPTETTDENGQFILPGAPISTQNYEIIVTKDGYSTAQTYSEDVVTNPHPDPAHLSVGVDSITTKSFFIDLLSTLNITAKTYDTDAVVPNFTFTLIGNKIIGTDSEGAAIYKYSQEQTTDANGLVSLADFEPDTYNITIDNVTTGYDFAGSNPYLPMVLAPNNTTNLVIYLAPHTNYTLLVTVQNPDGTILADASVHLYKTDLTYDQTLTSNAYGQVFFTPLETTIYNLAISKVGYQNYLTEINVTKQEQQTISLATS